MNCPFCGSTQVMVTNSRPTRGDSQIWRRRKCLGCGEVYTTYEKINLSHLIVVKKSGRKERFRRVKLFSGIYHSSIDRKNVDRGEMSEFSEKTTNQIIQEILKLKRKEIHSTEITEMVLNKLKKTAPDTFLRYLAYREGSDRKKLGTLLKKYTK